MSWSRKRDRPRHRSALSKIQACSNRTAGLARSCVFSCEAGHEQEQQRQPRTVQGGRARAPGQGHSRAGTGEADAGTTGRPVEVSAQAITAVSIARARARSGGVREGQDHERTGRVYMSLLLSFRRLGVHAVLRFVRRRCLAPATSPGRGVGSSASSASSRRGTPPSRVAF